MEIIQVKLNDKEARNLRAAYRKPDTARALRVAVNRALAHARLLAKWPRPLKPNAATARTLRRKEKGIELRTRADIDQFVNSIPARK